MQLRIKICGITNVADALMAAEAGADAVGLNFYEQSPRFIDPAAALKIVEALPADVAIVGVFVNHRADEIGRLVESIKLDYAQLHGDQNSAQIGELPRDLRFIRAHRCVADDLASLADFLRRCRDMGRLPAAVLLDADAGAAFGGSGRLADWTMIQRGRPTLAGLPMILAGGLTPDNVAAAIQTVRPHAVDVASGVESSPGRKDPAKVRDFVAAAREAFARLE